MDDVVEQLVWMEPGVMLVKLDIKSAYRIVPVHPDDRRFLGMK